MTNAIKSVKKSTKNRMYAELEILIASNPMLIWCPLISMCFNLNLFKIATHMVRRFDDVLLFLMKSKMLKMPRK